MERLTYYFDCKAHMIIGDTEYTGRIPTKLAAYEDTGYSPAEIKSLESEWNAARSIVDAYREAEKQGLLIRLPFKVGDTVYVLERSCDGSIVDCNSWVKCEECEDYQQKVSECRIGTLAQAVSVIEMLGKTVFLSREEAEAALKGEMEDV